jgi:primosomal protein N' (replication factor Y)
MRGIVVEKVRKPAYKTRPIAKVLSEEPILTESQLNIAKKISEYYFCSLGETINAFLPFDFGKNRRPSVAKSEKQKAKSVSEIKPNKEQVEIITDIQNSKPKTIHLIHGVTGSGKTEIYLQLIAEALKKGQGAIVLVPEIALTPQTKARFEERFGDKVAMWHSELRETEKYRSWQEIKSGHKPIVLGARSAIFMPVKDLAYVVIDEEHESSYKQDQSPRYDARLVSEWLAKETGAKLILGSATPRIESYWRAKKNISDYFFYTMDKRIVQESMPPVKIVDLRDEFRKGNRSIISDALFESITETLGSQKQVMLLLNRRGAATFVSCRDCGHVEGCPNCGIPLTYHPAAGQVLMCHHCGYQKPAPVICPDCKSLAIKFFGLGTQRAEIEIKKLFPGATIARMDHDTTSKRGSHEEIFHDFKNEKFDILIGTQMIAKGWDLPNVSLVGVISADTMLNIPDFRSAEKTFSLLTQVAGRTGRGFHPGSVVIQTYNPENFAIQSAAKHNYEGFYEQEILSREKYSYPPFSNLIKLTYGNPDVKKVEIEAQRIFTLLSEYIGICATARKPISKEAENQIKILGPTPSFIEKMAGKYRYQLVIKLPIDKNQITSTPGRHERVAPWASPPRASRAGKFQTSPQIPNPKSQDTNKLETKNLKLKTLDVIKNNIKSGWQIDIDPESLL